MKRWIIRPGQKLTAELLRYEQEAKIEEIKKRFRDLFDSDSGILYGLEYQVIEYKEPSEDKDGYLKVRIGPGVFLVEGEPVVVPDVYEEFRPPKLREIVDGVEYYYNSSGNILTRNVKSSEANSSVFLCVRRIFVEKDKNLVENGYEFSWYSEIPSEFVPLYETRFDRVIKSFKISLKKELLLENRAFRDALKIRGKRLGTGDGNIPYFNDDNRLYIDLLGDTTNKIENKAYIESTKEELKFFAPGSIYTKVGEGFVDVIHHNHTETGGVELTRKIILPVNVLTDKTLEKPIDPLKMNFIDKENDYISLGKERVLLLSLPKTTFADDIAVEIIIVYDTNLEVGEYNYERILDTRRYFDSTVFCHDIHTIFLPCTVSVGPSSSFSLERVDFPPYNIYVKIKVDIKTPGSFELSFFVLLKKR